MLLLVVLSPMLLTSQLANAAPVAAHVAMQGAAPSAPAVITSHGAAPLALPDGTPAPCDKDPVACANAIAQPINGLYQTGVMVGLIVLSCLLSMGLIVVVTKGMVHIVAGEPRSLAPIIFAVVGIVVCATVGFKAPAIASSIVSGHITIPNPFNASGQ
jgi:hypothetical protein